MRERCVRLGGEVREIERRLRSFAAETALLVGDQGADALAGALRLSLDAATQAAGALRDETIRHEEQQARCAREVGLTASGLEAARTISERASDALRIALTARSLDRSTAERVLGREREAIASHRAELSRLDAQRASARARREERTARRMTYEAALGEAAGEVGEALEQSIVQARRRRDDARAAEGRSHALLERDRALRIDQGARETEAARAIREEERWRALADVVGAADGKRFRVYAQGITLDRLLAHANAQLLELAPRYSLVRVRSAPHGRSVDALALALLDREAGEALRSVRSLSGGETFLVSLALALGLSVMTSEHAPLGSLFLDEGFGALDPDSLELALAALDTLRASGRQVAIVTHVAAVAERFSARVEVVPGGGGRSTVRVVAA